jgi:hypothetical protein
MNARCANLHRSIGRIHQIPSTASKYLAVPVCSEYIGYMVLVWPSSMANGNIDCTPYLPDFSAYIQLKKSFQRTPHRISSFHRLWIWRNTNYTSMAWARGIRFWVLHYLPPESSQILLLVQTEARHRCRCVASREEGTLCIAVGGMVGTPASTGILAPVSNSTTRMLLFARFWTS